MTHMTGTQIRSRFWWMRRWAAACAANHIGDVVQRGVPVAVTLADGHGRDAETAGGGLPPGCIGRDGGAVSRPGLRGSVQRQATSSAAREMAA